nr:MAG TPA_asm: hypothetical protein [Caudoviricetes sp.]
MTILCGQFALKHHFFNVCPIIKIIFFLKQETRL